jgi:hypothetical protein
VDAKAFLSSTPWSVVEELNSALCLSGGYQVGRTSDGYELVKEMWEGSHKATLTVIEAADLCRNCHQLSPFLFLNGNTFVALARIALKPVFESLGGTPKSRAIGNWSLHR